MYQVRSIYPYLEQAVALAVSEGLAVDSQAANAAVRLSSNAVPNCARLPAAIETDLGVDTESFQRQRALLAQMRFDLDASSRATFDRQLMGTPSAKPIHLLGVGFHNETPMPIRLRDKLEEISGAASTSDMIAGAWLSRSQGLLTRWRFAYPRQPIHNRNPG
ncbi:unnamed protein product [Prorocentrum cordatum]|uniref:Uncharacterized protein n=1 Tax=Prorocentrum cordatum TaxID=2364126 RepID=A0ABN9TKH2_9DINO|nr:unnamed protein product [Polarella glacialis]